MFLTCPSNTLETSKLEGNKRLVEPSLWIKPSGQVSKKPKGDGSSKVSKCEKLVVATRQHHQQQ